MKKSFKALIAVILVLALTICVSGCSEAQSAYDIAVANGFDGTEVEWLASLKTDSAYDIAVANGFDGTESQWLASLHGKSAYDIAVANGFDGTEVEWLESLNGEDSVGSYSIDEMYASAVASGYSGTKLEFIAENISYDVDEASTIEKASSLALLSAVDVYCSFEITIMDRWGRTSTTTATSAGAGVICQINKSTGDAYIITNYHVVYYSEADTKISNSIQIWLYGLEFADYGITATYVGGSMEYDIAVLKVTNCELLIGSDYRAIDVANSDDVIAGQTAIAVGNPEAEGFSVTSGVVSVESEEIEMSSMDGSNTIDEYRVIRIDTAVNSGNSGGGLYNIDGKLIGIVNAKAASTDVENIGYAIPSNIAIGVAQNIIDNAQGNNGRGIKYYLGVEVSIDDITVKYDSEAKLTKVFQDIKVTEITAGGLADGHLQVGDIIVSVKLADDSIIEVNKLYSITDALLKVRKNDVIVINVLRLVNDVETEVAVSITITGNGTTIS